MAGGGAAARVRNRRGEGARLRDEIVAGAVELLDETGDPGAITLRSVARRVGIAAPSIYRHFPDQPAIVLAVVQQQFAELEVDLRAAVNAAGEHPRRRLCALADAYLEFAEQHPGRYRAMFGGHWQPALPESSVTDGDLAALGEGVRQLVVDAVEGCVVAGYATSTNLYGDAVALWLGLHGYAHQRSVSREFPWPADVAERLINSLAHFTD